MDIFAPAKLNLYLHITGKRPDGYHFLDSLVVFTDIGDNILIEEADAFSFHIKGPFAGALSAEGENNLVVRIAKAASEHFQKPLNVQITLTKNLPLGAGLGGGSSDAAAALHGLLDHWDITPDQDTLDNLLLKLGSDLPACFRGTPLRMRGVGGKIAPIENRLPSLFVVLAYPAKPSDTGSVYQNISPPFVPEIKLPKLFENAESFIDFLQSCGNDLSSVAIKNTPEISEALYALGAQPSALLTRMSGSGSACFSLFEKEEEARKAASNISAANPSWWVAQGCILSSTP